MKKIILSIILLAINYSFNFAQTIKEFPEDDAGFISTYSSLLKTCNRDDCKKVTLWFDQSFSSSKAKAYLPLVKSITQTMLQKKASAYPAFYNFTLLLQSIDSAKTSTANVEQNLKILQAFIQQSSVGNLKLFSQYNDYLINLFSTNSIYHSNTRKWKTTSDFKTIFENNKPIFEFQNTDLIATTTNDTIVIKSTTGKYYPLENVWQGSKGKIHLTRAGFDATNNFVEFSDHTIDLSKSDIVIDNASLTFKPMFNEIIKGKYTDRLLQTKTQSKQHPTFVSQKNDILFNTDAKEVKLVGGFTLEGNTTYCVSSENRDAELKIYDKNNKEKIVLIANKINIEKQGKINIEECMMKIILDSNEIYHPYVNFSYDSKTRNIKAYRDLSKPLSKQPFSSDYHKMFIYADELKWNIDSTNILFGMIGISDYIPAIFESYNYYHKGLENKYKGTNEAGPLLKIYRYFEKIQSKNIDAVSMAQEINTTAPYQQTEQIFYKLTEDGYIGYNSSTRTITVKDKLINQVLSSKQQQDYDNMKFASFKRYNNARLNTKSNILEIYGVEEVKISDKSQVKFLPYVDTVKIKKNRNLEVGGRIIAGKVDFVSPVFEFDYDSYTFNMKKIDSLILYVPEGDGTPNELGEVKLVRSQTAIQNLSGTLFISEPDNKSGAKENLMYPYFVSKDTANTFYDNGKHGNKYSREKFKFNIEAFRLDSLTTIPTEKINLKGELVAGNIFEPLKANLTLQEDKSLGTQINISDKGLKLYRKDGRYFSALKLSKDGLSGKGIFEFGSAKLHADTAFFFEDSVYAELDSINITKNATYKFPDVRNKGLKMEWNAIKDSVVMTPNNNQKFSIFNNAVSLDGVLILDREELKATGTLEWYKTKLKSNDISFTDISFKSKNGQLNLIGDNGVSLLRSNDVNTNFDVVKRIADIELNTNDTIPLELFQYVANPKFIKYELDKNLLQLKAKDASSLFFLQSTNPEKELLTFETNTADLNLKNNTIYFGGIKNLKLTDSKIQPYNEEIYIEPDGSVRNLKKATVIFNANNDYHTIKNANIEIKSKNKFVGNGEYEFKTTDGLTQIIKIKEIDVNNSFKKEITVETSGKKKIKQLVTDEDKIYTYAKTEITEEDKFKLNKSIHYKGAFEFDSKNKDLTIDGYAKVVLKTVETDWIPIKQKLDPNKPEITIDSLLAKAKNLITGIFYDRYLSEFYSNVLREKRNKEDAEICVAKGNFVINSETNDIIFGNNNAFTNPTLRTNAFKYNEVIKKVNATGEINLGLQIGQIKAIAIGDIEYNGKDIILNADLALKTLIDSYVAQSIISNFVAADSNYIYSKYRKNTTVQRTLSLLCKDSLEAKYVISALMAKDSLSFAKSIEHNIIFSGTKFYWDAVESSFKSVGEVTVPYFGENLVKKTYKAYIEIGYGENLDFINIILETKSKKWLYIRIKNGQMGISSSVTDIYNYVSTLPEYMKVVKDGRNTLFELAPASIIMKEDFMMRMEDFQERFKSKLEPK